MASLTENEKSFVQLMRNGPEQERHGYELLIKRGRCAEFFDSLAAEGFFSSDKRPVPVAAGDGTVRLPYWTCLDFLQACARAAGEAGDLTLAAKVMAIVREVTPVIGDNYHTAVAFAQIIGLLPVEATTLADMDMVAAWVASRFERGMVAHSLDEHVLGRFLGSARREDHEKAVAILRSCTAIEWERRPGTERSEPAAVVEAYWLEELLKHHAAGFGRAIPDQAAAVLEERLCEAFGGERASLSWIHRPAVEEHSQNHSWNRLENGLLAGLRDILLGWCKVDATSAKPHVERLLRHDAEILRRIGINVLDERWADMRELYRGVLGPELFRHGHVHELHGLLVRRFEEFTDEEKAATLEAIRQIPRPEGKDAEHVLQIIQGRWLQALSSTAYQPAREWLAALRQAGIPRSEHADFNTYFETSWGPGPAPYQVPELVAFADDGSVVDKLNSFKPSEDQHRSIEALVDALQKAVQVSPASFVKALPRFLEAHAPYQFGVIQSFRDLWRASDRQTGLDWDDAWLQLIAFVEQLTERDEFWAPPREDNWYGRDAIVSAAAQLMEAGTRDDDHAYPEALLPRAWALIQRLLERTEPAASADDPDPMSRAINTPKGRAIEALFNHTLRICRLSARRAGNHEGAWEEARPAFDAELRKTETGNFEFSTLTGAYLTNLDYMSRQWVEANIARIFPAGRPANLRCALAGLAYSRPTRRLYALLRDAGVIDAALRLDLAGRESRKQLVERIMLAYLWEEEAPGSPRLGYAFENNLAEDLENGAWLFWQIRDEAEQLSTVQIERILAYWERCVAWAAEQHETPGSLMAGLGHLAWYMKDLDGRNRDLLLAVVPSMLRHHDAYELLAELIRLVDVSPAAVADVLKQIVDLSGPMYDYEDRLKTLIRALASSGQRETALYCADKLISVPGMDAVFRELIGGP